MTAKPHSDPHSSPREFTQVEIEQPLHDFIDMEAYDVVAGETYRALVEQNEALGKTYDQLHGRLVEFSQTADFHRRENERLKEQLEAKERLLDLASAMGHSLEEQLEAERRTSAEYDRENTILSGRVQGLEEQLETQQAALSEFLSHPVDNKAIERLRAAVSIPAKERPLYTDGSLTVSPLPPGAERGPSSPAGSPHPATAFYRSVPDPAKERES